MPKPVCTEKVQNLLAEVGEGPVIGKPQVRINLEVNFIARAVEWVIEHSFLRFAKTHIKVNI